VQVDPGPNLEARARDARYRALEEERVGCGATAILVGHTADDQAETVLLNVLRGAAGAGLAGMAPVRGRVVRPLLGVRRAETAELCARLGLSVVCDPMNEDRAFGRVALRHDVLPLLERSAGRDLVPVLARQAAILRDESTYLDALAASAWPAARPSVAALVALPAVVARRSVRSWLGVPPPSFDEVERVLAVARGECRGTELANGRAVRRSRGELLVIPGPSASPPSPGGDESRRG
jgi:tRNA(Ile)-lysidine synthase